MAHPMTRGAELNHPRAVMLRRQIIQEKPFLRQIYEEWYRSLAAALPGGSEPALELGSGAGFLCRFIPDLITSEKIPCPGVNLVLDGCRLPFRDSSLRGIVMTGMLPRLARPRSFFAEAARCVRPGGAVALVEPWVSAWSKLIYRNRPDEPFLPDTLDWEIPNCGPLSGANVALPWMIFERDRRRFEREFPEWRIQAIRPIMPFRYLLSGGHSLRALMPMLSYSLIRRLEQKLEPRMKDWAMFAEIVILRNFITDKDLAPPPET
jgi:SAM-dependent methyltransferase